MGRNLPIESTFELLDFVPLGIFVLNSELKVLFWNACLEEWTHISRQEIVGQNITRHFPHLNQPKYLSRLNQIFEGGHPIVFSPQLHSSLIPVRRTDGKLQVQHITVTASPSATEAEFYALWSIQDVTDLSYQIHQHKTEQAKAQRNEAKYRNLINRLNAGFIVHAPDTHVLQCNETACKILGLTMEQMLGTAAIDSAWYLIREDGTVMAQEEYPVNRILSTQAPLENYIVGVNRGNETRAWILVTAFPEFDPNHQLKQVVVTFIDISELKQVEEALEKELLRSKALFNTSMDGVVVLDCEGNVVQASPSFSRMLGYTVQEILTLNVADWDAQWTREELKLIRESKVFKPLFETTHRRKDGSIYDVEISYTRLNLEGEVIHFCICRDITDRKQVEVDLQNSQARFAGILEIASDAIISANPDQNITLFNKGAEKIFGYKADEVLGQPLNLLMPDRLAKVHHLPGNQSSQSEIHTQPMSEESTIMGRRKDGTEFPAEASISKLSIDHEIIFTTFLRDITERQRAEAAMSHLAALVESSEDAIISKSLEGVITSWNTGAEKLFGYTAEEIVGQPVTVLMPEEKLGEETQILERIQRGESVEHYETQRRVKDGTLIDLSITVSPIKDANGAIIGASKIARDIREQKRSEAEQKCKEIALQQAMESAEAANLAKSMFLANMSHELRTPLNVILGFAQVMEHDLSLTSTQKQDLQTIRRSGDHLLSLINDILDLSKIEAGHCTLEEAPFDLVSLIYGLRTMMLERANTKHLSLIFDLTPEVPQFVIADEQKLRQILLNLLSNAIKFTQSGGVALRVRVKEWDGRKAEPFAAPSYQPIMLQFEVTDTGVGIALKEQSMIFDAFVQAEAGKKSISGTGLGLTISRKLLELMHGTVTVQSIPNVETTFTVTIPVCPTPGVNIQPEPQNCSVIGLVPGQPYPRILVVDDQRENRILMVRLLTPLGLKVREAVNGQEAIQVWQEWQPDLIWMDIRMPELDGYIATQQIRSLEREKVSIIIALTAQASQSDRAMAMAAGCNDYISKPFQQETIFLKLSEYLGLQYLYAEPESSPDRLSVSVDPEQSPTLDSELLSELSPAWLQKLEDAAMCGNDRAISELVTQLSPNLLSLRDTLINLAEGFQFEQILSWIQHSE